MIWLYREFTGNLAARIVGDKGGVDGDGAHMPKKEYLCNASIFAFKMFFLSRKDRTAFFPAQHYRNCQDTVKHMLMSVAVAKHRGMED